LLLLLSLCLIAVCACAAVSPRAEPRRRVLPGRGDEAVFDDHAPAPPRVRPHEHGSAVLGTGGTVKATPQLLALLASALAGAPCEPDQAPAFAIHVPRRLAGPWTSPGCRWPPPVPQPRPWPPPPPPRPLRSRSLGPPPALPPSRQGSSSVCVCQGKRSPYSRSRYRW
jgi:hypothetical protein